MHSKIVKLRFVCMTLIRIYPPQWLVVFILWSSICVDMRISGLGARVMLHEHLIVSCDIVDIICVFS